MAIAHPIRQRIAIIGTGISGMMAARALHQHHDITVYEANDYVGGHTNTISVDDPRGRYGIDTGFIVYNDRNYPLFSRLLGQLNVPTHPTQMSFGVHCEQTGLEYNGNNLIDSDSDHLLVSFLESFMLHKLYECPWRYPG